MAKALEEKTGKMRRLIHPGGGRKGNPLSPKQDGGSEGVRSEGKKRVKGVERLIKAALGYGREDRGFQRGWKGNVKRGGFIWKESPLHIIKETEWDSFFALWVAKGRSYEQRLEEKSEKGKAGTVIAVAYS